MENDVDRFLNKKVSLISQNEVLLQNLYKSNLLGPDPHDKFDPNYYNVITKRFRDHWLRFFLTQLYNYEFSLPSFELWVYRGKQIGIINATEFYPGINGRIVYPTSVVLNEVHSKDFKKIYKYNDGSAIFMHTPEIESNEDEFIDKLVDGYFELKKNKQKLFHQFGSDKRNCLF